MNDFLPHYTSLQVNKLNKWMNDLDFYFNVSVCICMFSL